MTSQHEIDRQNDAKLLTPFLLMALVVVVGVLFEELAPHLLAANLINAPRPPLCAALVRRGIGRHDQTHQK
jgi:hypothetical protein